ncbi:UDP-N-acetylmuramoyl-tripeptide--D-alanyl-D-alanine ligase [Vibrio algarum]|uniref:UDP-N-acetylmuramoyl-tripeptide--D-alanyl-D-alanine ligase n=1 Tax=Vibrio algarum TaxID=3020714 RepID=A0ABT4YN76_9VIBR|nr:UDP-N-acetylmuramoyl-tripeptide--D-alanyl-D-alanine ligase [Vibrio sp. KJ40-1]MDB1122994.1 UDP-N-acetylmuramoyl-tripeptide--D-alanyl-D-alanine ligase [Vibrio sp. KJ40-1]
MISTSLNSIAEVLNCEVLGENPRIDSVSTDTRTISPGSLFIALVGDKFDAHDFCQNAKECGASALLVERKLPVQLPQVVVPDTRLALGQLASWVHKECDIKTLAITGSCGKTTVKEMVSSILSLKGKVLATAGNFNNDIGVPLTLLRSQPEIDYAVIELGANHSGEIAYTTDLVKPSVALVNNVAAAHLEGFGSIEGVKKAKGEIYSGLSVGDTAVINLDSHGEELWDQILTNKKVVSFSSSNAAAQYYAKNCQLDNLGYASFTIKTPVGEIDVKLSVVGEHNVPNALAATALAMEFGCSLADVAKGLATVVNVKGRVEINQLTDEIILIDDSYNASVPAMKSAVDLLSTFSGTRWLVLGYMAELGQESLELHRQLGEYAAQFNFENVLTFGVEAKVISDMCHGLHFSTHDELIDYMLQQLQTTPRQAHTVLVKGANGARMSVVVEALKEKHK